MKVRKENIYDENKSSLSQCQLVSCGSRGICGCISKENNSIDLFDMEEDEDDNDDDEDYGESEVNSEISINEGDHGV